MYAFTSNLYRYTTARDKVVEELGRCGGEGAGEGGAAGCAPPAVVSLAHVQLRETHFLGGAPVQLESS